MRRTGRKEKQACKFGFSIFCLRFKNIAFFGSEGIEIEARVIYTNDMKNFGSDSFAEDRRPVSWGRLALGLLFVVCVALVGWVALTDVSVPRVQVVRSVPTPSAQ